MALEGVSHIEEKQGKMEERIGIIMNGVTGRMGLNQHLIRSILRIREEGGIRLSDGRALLPDPILLGRDGQKLQEISRRFGGLRWSTDLNACLADEKDSIYFDSGVTGLREKNVLLAIAKGKHVYCEKPLSTSAESAVRLAQAADAAGICHGIVQDKLFLPGVRKLRRLIDAGFFGKILSIRGEFGYWVFEGDWGLPAQRPSWNYRKEEDGGIILDMFAHWRYLLDHTFGKVEAVSCLGATHVSKRVDERGQAYECTADDAAYGTFLLKGGVVAQFNSSWTTRVYRDELFTMQVDGTEGSAVAGLRECRVQHRVNTPRPVWNPDVPNPICFRDGWAEVPDNMEFDNAFKVQWELYLKAVVEKSAFPYNFWDGARGVQLADLAVQSWNQRRWIEIPELGKETA
jgi:predicted dehydrogenase